VNLFGLLRHPFDMPISWLSFARTLAADLLIVLQGFNARALKAAPRLSDQSNALCPRQPHTLPLLSTRESPGKRRAPTTHEIQISGPQATWAI
jgi:hypothetical protein